MGSSNPQTTTTVNRVEIPPWLEPHMQRIAGDAGALYAEGVGPQYYPGQTWIDFNPYQVEAQRLIGETAVTNDLSPRAYDTAAGIMDDGGISPHGWDAVAPLHDIASGAHGIGTGQRYGTLINQEATRHPVHPGLIKYLDEQGNVGLGNNQITTGGLYGDLRAGIENGNPYFQAALDDQLQRTQDAINSQFSGSGRYASGAHTGVLADRLGEARTRALAQQYNQDIANRMGAIAGQTGVEGQNIANRLSASQQVMDNWRSAEQQQFQNQMAGLLGLSNVEGTNITNQGNAALQLGGFYQGAQDDAFKAALATPALAASRYADWDRLLDLGGQIEARDAQMLKDAIDRFEFQNQMPWNQLGMYGQQLQGVNAGGTQTQIAERPAAPLGQRLLGGAALGAGAGSLLGFGAPGALIGGLGGGLLGLLG